jgi:quercetin dioxygenase-like cupin family protein
MITLIAVSRFIPMKANYETKKKGKTMNPLTQFKKISILPLLIALTLFVAVTPTRATPQSGVTTEILSQCNFGQLDVLAKWDLDPTVATDFWMLAIASKGATDVYVVRNTFVLGGTTGWHTHPGPSLITVTAGTITAYEGNCTPHIYVAPACFIDPGAGHVHLLRNNGSVNAVTVATQFIPHGFPRRIDANNPGCAGIN